MNVAITKDLRDDKCPFTKLKGQTVDILNLPVAAVSDANVQEKKDEEKDRKRFDKIW